MSLTPCVGLGGTIRRAPEDFLVDGDRFTGSSPLGQGTVVLDYARETLELRARGLDLGDLPEGPQPITVTVVVGEDSREVGVRMVRKGKRLKY